MSSGGGGMQAQEREGPAAAGSGQDAAPASPDTQGEPPTPVKAPAFDLFNLVVSYKRLELFLEPVQDVVDVGRFLLSWQMPTCSLLTCLGVNFLLLTLSEAAWYGVGALLISLPAVLGYLQEVCRVRLSEPQLVRRKFHSVRREDVKKVRLSRAEAVAEVKGFLIQLEALLSRLCSSCEATYRVLYWENPRLSSWFYGGLLGSVCALYLLPLCWVLTLINSALFLGNPAFYQVLLQLKETVEQCLGPKPLASSPEPAEPEVAAAAAGGGVGGRDLPDRTPTPTSTEDLTPGSVEEAEEAEPDDEFKDAIEDDDDLSQCSVDLDLGLSENGSMSKNEAIRSRVSRLTERLRKHRPSNNFGNCASCSATFSVLKKRRNCSNCGNSFCARCCSYKVPKAFMGATAPDAQRETVFVCGPCNQALVK
uniref:Protrudin n=1 Tax=Sphenodon punctatus TaxID=8508 RepID=A0A8D0H4S1_SPHPU